MSTLFVNNLNTASGSTITIPTGKTLVGTDEGTIRTPGTILQVKQTYFQTEANFSGSGAFVSDIYLDCVITPKSTSSKILIQVMLNYSTSTAGCGNGIVLLFDLNSNSKYGHVIGFIEAKGLHTNLLVTVKFSPDGRFAFAGVSKGSMELLAIDLGNIPVWNREKNKRYDTQRETVYSNEKYQVIYDTK